MSEQVHWAIQSGFGEQDGAKLKRACKELGSSVWEFESRPFSNDLPDIPTDIGPVVFYGTPRAMEVVRESGLWSPGIFGDAAQFTFQNQSNNWGKLFLNNDAAIVNLTELSKHQQNGTLFARPVSDDKSFTGRLFGEGELTEWANKLVGVWGAETQVVVGPAKQIKAEWRLFVVEGKVISGSQYRLNELIQISPEVPNNVLDFGNSVISVWAPDDVFGLDIGQVDNKLYVIEANGFNGCGFYEANTEKVVNAINEFLLLK